MTNGDSLPSAPPIRSQNGHDNCCERAEEATRLDAAVAANLQGLGYGE
jgi:hypothetical protein